MSFSRSVVNDQCSWPPAAATQPPAAPECAESCRDYRRTHGAGADLSGADLRGADLRGTVLDGSNLAGARLEGANLFKATLDGADLYKCDLSGAQFLHCGQLEVAQNWQSAYRDEDLACGAAIPVMADDRTDEPSQR